MSTLSDRRLLLHDTKVQRKLGVSSSLEDRLRRGTLDVEDLKYLCRNHPDVELRKHIRQYKYPFAVFMGRHGIGYFHRQNFPTFAHNGNSPVSAADLTSYTLAVNLGTEDPSRVAVTIIIGTNATAAPLLDFSSVTVNGIAATEVTKQFNSAGTNDGVLGIHRTSVPTGGAVNVGVTFTEGATRCGCALWSVYNLNSPTYAATNGSVGTGLTLSGDLNVQAGMVIFAGNAQRQTTANRVTTWVGVTEEYDEIVENLAWTHSGGSFTATVNETPRAINATLGGATTNHMLVSAAFF